jgi:uncharacterized membrane protein YdbT with pleckstrin-like domain
LNYVESTLLPDERVIHSAKVHWFVYVPAAIWLGVSFWIASRLPPDAAGNPMVGILGMLGFYYLIRAIVERKTTELAVTTKRVVAKFGFLSRKTVELNHSKVESFNVNQGLLGRLFGFGTIMVNGSGGMRAPIQRIAEPLEFRRHMAVAIDASQSGNASTAKVA